MLLAIEGVDGCGKSTQVGLLAQRLSTAGLDPFVVSFPRYGDAVFGDLIRRFLRGELGDVETVDPRLVALLFAGDRAAEAPRLREALCDDRIVICDRYFYSNLAYQGAKLKSEADLDDFNTWLRKLEFGHWAVPAPACSIYLDVHQDERRDRIETRLSNGASGGAVPNDIHERDLDLQARVEQVFRSYAEVTEELVRIDCWQMGRHLTPEEVHERVMRVLVARQLLAMPRSAVASTPH